MNYFIFLLKGLIFLVIVGMMSACPIWFKPFEKEVSLPSQSTKNPFLLKQIFLAGAYSSKSLHFLLDNEHVIVVQGARGGFFIDLKNERILHSYPFEGTEFGEISGEQIFSQDQYLLLQGRGATDLWEIASGKLLQSWRDPDTNAKATAVSRSGKIIFTSEHLRQLQNEKTVREEGSFHTLFLTRVHLVLSVATISANENFLATGGLWDKRIILWDIQAKKDIAFWQVDQHVRTLSFSPDNQYLYAGTYKKLEVYEVTTQKKVSEISHPYTYNGAEYLGSRNAILIVSDEGEIQLSRAPSGEQLWSYQTGQEVSDWNHYPRSDLLAIRLSNGEIVILELKSGQVRLRFQSPFQVMGPLDVSKDGKFLAMMGVSEKGWEVAVWQLPEKGSSGK